MMDECCNKAFWVGFWLSVALCSAAGSIAFMVWRHS